jgi:hypothetical protein
MFQIYNAYGDELRGDDVPLLQFPFQAAAEQGGKK